MRNLNHAFTHCVDRYAGCPIYRELIAYGLDRTEERTACRTLAAAS